MRLRLYERFGKRWLDVIFSALALVILAPLFLVLIILSKCLIHGKVFFTQYRPGRNGKLFKLYKFRSMTEKTDEYGALLPDAARITKFGRWLRATCLDELPQLINILRGDMSFVGPRPRLVVDMIFYPPETLAMYQSLRPGLTGLDQIARGRSYLTWEQIFAKDRAYQTKITFWQDCKIVLLTIGALLRRDRPVPGQSQTPREYYYAASLRKQNLITREQYQAGQIRAKDIIDQRQTVTAQPDLQAKGAAQ